MSNISTATRYLGKAVANPQLFDLNEPRGESRPFDTKDNADFLAAVRARLAEHAPGPRRAKRAKQSEQAKRAQRGEAARSAPPETPLATLSVAPDGVLAIGLIGEYGQLGYALRRAQEVIRIDRTPSHWSHAFLFLDPISLDAEVNRDPERSPRVLEAALHPSASASALFAFRNGVNVRRFSDYARARFDASAAPSAPNIALLCLGLNAEERLAIRERALCPETDLMSYDLPDLLGTWFHYALSLGKRMNPLVQGVATPSASFVQLAYDAAGIDLSPGANDRNFAPEHLWQGVRFLHPMFQAPGADGDLQSRPFFGYYCVREPSCLLAPADADLPRSFEAFVDGV